MEQRIVLLFSASLGTVMLNSVLAEKRLDELQRIGFLLGDFEDPYSKDPLGEVFELKQPPQVVPPDPRIFFRESPLPHYRQLEYRPRGRRSQIRQGASKLR